MFYYVQGTVAQIAPNLAVIDCGGVGYACRTTSNTISSISVGKVHKLYTHLYVKEEIFELYGFATQEELDCFQMLLSVSGVGPKAALAILSFSNPSGLASAIVSGNEKALTSAPGIGKKIAQRIILELKDKMSKGQLSVSGLEQFSGGNPLIREDKLAEASAALMSLGYSQQEIMPVLKGMDLEHATLEEIIRQSLKKMIRS